MLTTIHSEVTAIVIVGLLASLASSHPLSPSSHSPFVAQGSPVQLSANVSRVTNSLNTTNPISLFTDYEPVIYQNVPLELLDPQRYDNITVKMLNFSGKSIIYDPYKDQVHDQKGHFLGINWKRVGGTIGCLGDPCWALCPKHTGLVWSAYDARQLTGIPNRMSQILCGPGGISSTNTKSWSYTVSVSAGPNLALTKGLLQSVSLSFGFSYGWGGSKSIGYNIDCSDGGNWPCIAVFTPDVAMLNGWARHVRLNQEGQTCGDPSWDKRHVTVHVPLTNKGCDGKKDSPCGANGAYSHCFYTDWATAHSECGRWMKLTHPTPYRRHCPKEVYKEFSAHDPIWTW